MERIPNDLDAEYSVLRPAYIDYDDDDDDDELNSLCLNSLCLLLFGLEFG